MPAGQQMTAGKAFKSQGTVVILNQDLMLGIAIGNTAKALGFAVERVTQAPELIECLQQDRPDVALAIIDMNLPVDWSQIGEWIGSGIALPPILGFGPHVDIDGRRAAKQAGLTRIVSNGEFHQDMAGLIQRYARNVL